ncbi:hypothetical protein [Sphingomonas daechungensis]|uniref:hypothetical protein n=1 Tax=Sphingomonas daechungensis TaxID=1176646 RepID=UPI00378426A7
MVTLIQSMVERLLAGAEQPSSATVTQLRAPQTEEQAARRRTNIAAVSNRTGR